MVVEVGLHSLGIDRLTRSPVVVLRERDGHRVLPIWIGAMEASAIARAVAGSSFPRPLTHDLLVQVLNAAGLRLLRVEIPLMVKGTYHAVLLVRRDAQILRIDARPSDAIALAVRTGASIGAADDLLRDVPIEMEDSDVLDGGAMGPPLQPPRQEGPGSAPQGPEELADYLRRLDPEDFGRFTP